MNKYEGLWRWIGDSGSVESTLTFDEIEEIAGCPLDHSFLGYKKDLERYGYEVARISLKKRTVLFRRLPKKS